MDTNKQIVLDSLTGAIEALHVVHRKMVDALCASQNTDDWIESRDFAELNALSAKLDALSERFAPEYRPFRFEDL